MKSACLVPYSPYPVDSGAKAEMCRHLQVLKELGQCKIVSAKGKPVGAGWTDEAVRHFLDAGFEISFREDYQSELSLSQMAGIAYAAIFKALHVESAFGHSNPYHRFAFPPEWFQAETSDADIVVVNYSFWSWLPCACPKVVALLDLWSDYMRFWNYRETEDLALADLVLSISKDEENSMRSKGTTKLMWCPPGVEAIELEDSFCVGIVGSASRFNIDGIRWLEKSLASSDLRVRVYGGLAESVRREGFDPVGRYEDKYSPYRECGIILMTTTGGMGVQIKGVEALASGRAIIARKRAMRGLPEHDAWIEVSTPEDMLASAIRLRDNRDERISLSRAARNYYDKYLAVDKVNSQLVKKYRQLAKS